MGGGVERQWCVPGSRLHSPCWFVCACGVTKTQKHHATCLESKFCMLATWIFTCVDDRQVLGGRVRVAHH